MTLLNKRRWKAGTITRALTSRSYEIQLLSGRKLIRNRRHIIKDSQYRHDTPTYNFYYDDIQLPTECTQNNVNINENVNNNNNYVTRSGRIVRPPIRWGIPHPQSS